MNKELTIKKGRHKYKLWYPRFPKILRWDKELNQSYRFLFRDSCIYDLKDEDQHDVNKLFGISLNFFPTIKNWKFVAPHHRNSCRFGWRPTANMKEIEIVIYEYRNSIRKSTIHFTNVELNKIYKYSIVKLAGSNTITYKIKPGKVGWEIITKSSNKIPVKKLYLRYKLDFYFGGNETAPHDITIYMEEDK